MSSTSEKCIDTNECQLNTHDCHPVAICSNFQGSFDCLCPFGYEGDGHGAVIGCEDVDECYENTHSCQENQFCVNQSGTTKRFVFEFQGSLLSNFCAIVLMSAVMSILEDFGILLPARSVAVKEEAFAMQYK